MEDKLKQLTNRLENNSIGLSPMMMTDFEKQTVMDYMSNKAPSAAISSLNLAFWFKFAQAVTLYRPKIMYGTDEPVYINFYGLLIAPSGNYKDQTLRFLDKSIMIPYQERFKQLHDTYTSIQMSEVREEASSKFEKSKSQKEMYVEAHSPRFILMEGSRGTVQGWHSQREAIGKANFGAANYLNGEFGDILERYNESDSEILTYLKESYDGETQARVIKGDKALTAVKDVPSNMFAHSPLSSILNPQAKTNLLKYLNSGLARRTFICYEPEKSNRSLVEQEGLDIENYYNAYDEAVKEVEKRKQGLINKMEEILNFVNNNRTLTLSPKAKLQLRIYRDACTLKSKGFNLFTDEGISGELDGRWFKTLKLAGLVALSEMKTEISESHMIKAMLQVEFYSKYIQRLYNATTPDATYRIFEFLKKNLDIKFSTNELIKLVGISKTTMSKYRVGIASELKDMAINEGYEFIYTNDTQKITYMLRNRETVDLNNLTISRSEDLAVNYEPETYKWGELGEVTKDENFKYSANTFSGGHRTKENYKGVTELIMLDIDAGWSLNEAILYLERMDIMALISTTKSHQGAKEGVICDRFRIIIPLKYKFKGTAEEYSEMMVSVYKYFMNKPDSACKDASRYYNNNPKAEYLYITGKQLDYKDIPVSIPMPEGKQKIDITNFDNILAVIKYSDGCANNGRNSYLNKAGWILQKFYNINSIELKEILYKINDLFSPPLSGNELEKTVIKSLKLN